MFQKISLFSQPAIGGDDSTDSASVSVKRTVVKHYRIFSSHFKIHGVAKKAERRISDLNAGSDGGRSSENKRRKQSEGRSGG